ncbi:hypothetical protein Tco_0870201, partial [Tanacetum coccineum]
DLTVALDSTNSSILPPPLLDSDWPFTAELSASVTLNSLGNEDKVFKPGILVYHAIHDKNLVTLEKNLRENISSGTLLVFKEPSFLLPPPEPQDECLNFEPNLVMKNVVLNEDFYQSKKVLPLNVKDVDSLAFVIWTFLPYFTYIEESPLIFSFRIYKAFSSEVHASRLLFSGWGVKSLSTYPMTVGFSYKKNVILGQSEPMMSLAKEVFVA